MSDIERFLAEVPDKRIVRARLDRTLREARLLRKVLDLATAPELKRDKPAPVSGRKGAARVQ
jgi:beta-phosphoglucomutase-like phosphatase (HAD superfamily)